MKKRTVVVALSIALAAGSASVARADGYDDEAYRQHDVDNMERTFGRQRDQATDPAYLQQLSSAGAETELANLGTQLAEVDQGRLYGGLGQLLPGGAVGRAHEFHVLEPIEVHFLSRTGAKLDGRVFWDGEAGPHPMITITSGSIQGPQSGYWWAAKLLAANGYVVLTWDTQGQGESETFGHAPGDPTPTGDGVPSQQDANFVDSTVDAIGFLLSTPEAPYRPGGWSDDDVAAAGAAAASAGEAMDWFNPVHGVTDRSNLGIAGHSLGGSAVSIVAQCSDASERWREVEACPDAPLPIRGGRLRSPFCRRGRRASGARHEPASRRLLPQHAADAGAARSAENLETHDAYVEEGVDTYSITVRAGTHAEWSFIPLLIPATSYGIDAAGYYTLAWFDRYVHPSPERQAAAAHALRTGPVPDGLTGGADEWAWRAHFLSARRLSAFRFRAPGTAASCSQRTTCAPTRGCPPSATGPARTPTPWPPARRRRPRPEPRVRSAKVTSCARRSVSRVAVSGEERRDRGFDPGGDLRWIRGGLAERPAQLQVTDDAAEELLGGDLGVVDVDLAGCDASRRRSRAAGRRRRLALGRT